MNRVWILLVVLFSLMAVVQSRDTVPAANSSCSSEQPDYSELLAELRALRSEVKGIAEFQKSLEDWIIQACNNLMRETARMYSLGLDWLEKALDRYEFAHLLYVLEMIYENLPTWSYMEQMNHCISQAPTNETRAEYQQNVKECLRSFWF